MMITIPLTLKTMLQLIIKPWMRSQGLWYRKQFKKHEKNCKVFLKKKAEIRDIKILKNIPLHL